MQEKNQKFKEKNNELQTSFLELLSFFGEESTTTLFDFFSIIHHFVSTIKRIQEELKKPQIEETENGSESIPAIRSGSFVQPNFKLKKISEEPQPNSYSKMSSVVQQQVEVKREADDGWGRKQEALKRKKHPHLKQLRIAHSLYKETAERGPETKVYHSRDFIDHYNAT